MLHWIAENTIVSLALASLVILACRILKARPAVCHLLWLLVLLRLVAPPLPLPQLGPEAAIRTHVRRLTQELGNLVPVKTLPKEGSVQPWRMSGDELAAGHSQQLLERAPESLVASGAPPVAAEEPADPGGARVAPAGVAPGTARSIVAEVGREAPRPAEVLPPATRPQAPGRPGSALLTPGRIWFLLLALWAAGALFAFRRHLKRTLVVKRLVDRARPAPASLVDLARGVASRLRIPLPEVRVMDGLRSPFVWGLGRTVLLWPAGHSASPRCARGVLAHELAHIRRRDHRTAWLEIAVTTFLWWNPLVWLVRARMRFYAELSCDAWAVAVYPDDRRAYAATLIDVAESVSGALALGHAEAKPQNFERRLRMVMRERMSCRIQPLIAVVAIAAAVCLYPTMTAAQGGAGSSDDAVVERAVRAELLARRGTMQFECGEWKEAVGVYRELVQLQPRNGKAWHRLGYCLLPLGEHREAAAAFRKQAELGFQPANASYNLACAHALSGDADTALDFLERAIRGGFTDTGHMEEDADLRSLREHDRFAALLDLATEIRDLIEEAKEAFEGYEWAEAAKSYGKLVQLMPGHGQSWHRLGYARIVSGQHRASTEAFATQLSLGYRKPTALYNLACASALVGEREKAMDWLQQSVEAGFDQHKLFRTDEDLSALRQDPRFEKLRLRVLARAKRKALAETAHEVADWENAAKHYAQIVAEKPEDGDSWGRLADVYAELGRHADARAALERRLQLGDDVARTLFQLGRVHAKADDPDAAFHCIERAIDIGFRDKKSLEQLGSYACLSGDARLTRVHDRLADAEILDGWKACDWQHLQRKAEAKIAENPDHGPSFLKLGWAHLRQGRFDRAIRAFERQEELGHLRSIARYNVACCYAKKGEEDAAFRSLAQAVDLGFRRPQHIRTDPDLASLRDDARFVALLARLKRSVVQGKDAKKKNPEKKADKPRRSSKKKHKTDNR